MRNEAEQCRRRDAVRPDEDKWKPRASPPWTLDEGATMYKRILIATDGSELAQSAVAAGIALASLARGTIVAVHVRMPISVLLYGEASAMVPRDTQALIEERGKEFARECLARVAEAARQADVRCEVHDIEEGSPAHAIVRKAKEERCDLIVMASHGRGALSRALIGSETSKVLAHATQPVLVTR
jgi:nucleotide-binding universal stress UspA family protein